MTKKQIMGRKQNQGQENPFIVNLPLFVMIFMIVLFVFKLLAEATVALPQYAVIGLSMASAMFIMFMKTKC